jgi:hypothetical protein
MNRSDSIGSDLEVTLPPSSRDAQKGNLAGREAVNMTRAASAGKASAGNTSPENRGLGFKPSLGLIAKSILGGLLLTGLAFAVMSIAMPILAAIPVGLPLVLGCIGFGVTFAVIIPVAFQFLFCRDF